MCQARVGAWVLIIFEPYDKTQQRKQAAHTSHQYILPDPQWLQLNQVFFIDGNFYQMLSQGLSHSTSLRLLPSTFDFMGRFRFMGWNPRSRVPEGRQRCCPESTRSSWARLEATSYLSEGKAKADKAAKACALEAFFRRPNCLLPELECLSDFQAHMLKSFLVPYTDPFKEPWCRWQLFFENRSAGHLHMSAATSLYKKGNITCSGGCPFALHACQFVTPNISHSASSVGWVALSISHFCDMAWIIWRGCRARTCWSSSST